MRTSAPSSAPGNTASQPTDAMAADAHRAPEPDRPHVSRPRAAARPIPRRGRASWPSTTSSHEHGLNRPRALHKRLVHARQRDGNAVARCEGASGLRVPARALPTARYVAVRHDGRGAREDDHGVSAQTRGGSFDGRRHRSRLAREGRAPPRRLACDAAAAVSGSGCAAEGAVRACTSTSYNARDAVASTRRRKGSIRSAVSEQTTFDAVTHALMRSETDGQGRRAARARPSICVDRHRAHRRAVRGPRRRPAVPALRPLKPERARGPGEEPRVLPRSREHRVPRRAIRTPTVRPARNPTSSSRCPRTGCAPTSTWTTDRAGRRRRCSTGT